MENNQRLKDFLENSFLSPLLFESGVTDISFNGLEFYYQSNDGGRKKAEIRKTSEEVGAFLRQIANFAEKQFSYSNPQLDVSFGRYRLNATYSSVARVKDNKAFSFSLRLEREGSVLFGDDSFFPGKSKEILLKSLSNRESIVIAGETGSGKTELQKYLLLSLPESSRVIVIDNVNELELCRGDNLDLTTWLVDESVSYSSFGSLVRNALRNNPDFLVIAESRGGEMLDAVNSAMSGHPIITTIHATDLQFIPHRMARLAMMAGKNINFEDILEDIETNIPVYVFLKTLKKRGKVIRRIDSIGRIDRKTREMKIIFRCSENG